MPIYQRIGMGGSGGSGGKGGKGGTNANKLKRRAAESLEETEARRFKERKHRQKDGPGIVERRVEGGDQQNTKGVAGSAQPRGA